MAVTCVARTRSDGPQHRCLALRFVSCLTSAPIRSGASIAESCTGQAGMSQLVKAAAVVYSSTARSRLTNERHCRGIRIYIVVTGVCLQSKRVSPNKELHSAAQAPSKTMQDLRQLGRLHSRSVLCLTTACTPLERARQQIHTQANADTR
jgi:hypothetical protein